MSKWTPRRSASRAVGWVVRLMGVVGVLASPTAAPNAKVLEARAQLEVRVQAARELLQEDTATAKDPQGTSNTLAQWYNWPNWGNWGNWPNWNNWNNWGNWFNR